MLPVVTRSETVKIKSMEMDGIGIVGRVYKLQYSVLRSVMWMISKGRRGVDDVPRQALLWTLIVFKAPKAGHSC